MVEKYTNWHKSSRSGGNDNCIEVAVADGGAVGVRDTKDRSGPILEFTPAAWGGFLARMRAGDLTR